MSALVQPPSGHLHDYRSNTSSMNMDKVVQSVENATKRLSQISTNTTTSNKKRKAQNKIGPWKLGRTLGRGSTGRVRLAKNVNTGKLAAVKIVPKSNFKKLENAKYKRHSQTSQDGLPYGIEREIIIMKLISHPNIMGLYDVWENKNDLYLILEYIEGGELFDYLIKKGKLQEFEAVNYFKQIIDGISYLHQFNICHRDLKPENLLMDFNKNIKIADFGMAALEVREKMLETSCGSPHYASPEIVAGKNYHGAPSDIWSCGIILFALLTGHLPFDDENIRRLLLKVQHGKYIMPPDLSWEAKDLISKMLKVNPSQRIGIDEICKHPLLTKYPDPINNSPTGRSKMNLKNLNVKPIESVDKIDREILKNLSVLFHNCSDEAIISKLLSPNKCPEKMFYFLLMKYRNEHTSRDSHDYEDDTELTASESKNTLPRSTSIVKTITVDSATGEKHTTIKKVPHSTSHNSTKSSRQVREDRVLAKITNTPNSRSFKASNSFNKKKILLNNQVISRNSSSKSLKKSGSSKLKKVSSSSSKIKRHPTGLDLYHMDEPNTKMANADSKQMLTGNFGNKSLMNFEYICESSFDDKRELARRPSNKPTEKSKYKEFASLTRREKELTEKIKKFNEERDTRYQREELAKKEKERKEKQEKKEKIANREKYLEASRLQKQQEKALERLRSHKSNNDFADILPSRRFATDTPVSSLDPKSSSQSLLRAKSLANSQSTNSKATLDDNATKVLKKLGINGVVSPSLNRGSHVNANLNKNVKTSSSKNLSSYIATPHIGDTEIFEVSDEDKENLSIQSFNEREKSMISLKPTISNPKRKNAEKMKYTSLLGEVKENEQLTVNDETTFNNTLDSVQQSDWIPNPRFSRFSFGGILNTSKYDNMGDVTILNNLGSSGTVLRKSNNNRTPDQRTRNASRTNLKKTSSNLLGLGIDLKSLRHQEEANQTTFNPFGENTEMVSVDVTDSHMNSESKTSLNGQRSKIYIFQDDDMANDNSFADSFNNQGNRNERHSRNGSEYSNFDIISSRTAEIGMFSELRPSIVESQGNSNESLVNDGPDQRVRSMYERYEKIYNKENTLSRIDHPTLRPDMNQHATGNTMKDSPNKSTSNLKRNSNIEVFDSSSVAERAAESSRESNYSSEQISQQSDDTVRWTSNKSKGSSRVYTGGSAIDNTEGQQDKANINESSKDREDGTNDTEVKPFEPSINNMADGHNGPSPNNMFKRLSLNPKRSAPKAPSSSSVSANRKADLHEGKKDNWLKKIFSSLTSTPKVGAKESNLRKDMHTINSRLSSQDIFRVIKYQLELKQVEGSLSKVEMDEEFGIITGVIPSNILHGGRKLHFKIEVTDMGNSSTLCLTKVKGNDKSFHNLVNIVDYMIKQEEQRDAAEQKEIETHRKAGKQSELGKRKTDSAAMYEFSGQKVVA